MSRGRLLIWTESYWVGGSDRFLVDLLEGLDGRFDVLLAGNPHPAFDAWLADRVPWVLPRVTVPIANLVASPLARVRGRLAPPGPPPLAAEVPSEPAADPVAVATAGLRLRAAAVNRVRIERLLRRTSPDAVLINNGGYPGGESCRVLPMAARAAGARRVVHFVHNMAYPPPWPASVELRLDGAADRATDVWVTAADRAGDALARERRIHRGRIETVHYGIPPLGDVPDAGTVRAQLGFGPDDVGVVVLAAFERRKGHEVLLRSIPTLPGDVRVAFVGTGPEEGRLRALAQELGVHDRVRFAGWRGDVEAVLAASDALALPSLGNECLPFAILEAMRQALPVVTTDVAGIPEEVLAGVTGWVVAPGEEEALTAAIVELAGDRARARSMGAAGAERQRRMFDRDAMASRMVELLSTA